MMSGKEETSEKESGSGGVGKTRWRGEGQKALQGGVVGTGQEGDHGPVGEGKGEEGYIIYGLTSDTERRIFYVGLSRSPLSRLNAHRVRYGRSTRMLILDRAPDYSLALLRELFWIKCFEPSGLTNVINTERHLFNLRNKPKVLTVPFLIAMQASEKIAFRQAAALAGLNLTSWIRLRLREKATEELAAIGEEPSFLKPAKKKK